MSHGISQFDQEARALEKQAARDRDAARLSRGEVTPQDLRRENGIFAQLPLHRYRIAAIGGKPVAQK